MGKFWTVSCCSRIVEYTWSMSKVFVCVCVCVSKDTEKYQIEYLAQTGKVKYLMLDSRLERILRKTRFLIRLEIIGNNSSTSQQSA